MVSAQGHLSKDIMSLCGHYVLNGDVPIWGRPQWGRPQRGHYVLNGDIPVEDVLDRDILGGDIMSAQGRPQQGHLWPFLLLPLLINAYAFLLCLDPTGQPRNDDQTKVSINLIILKKVKTFCENEKRFEFCWVII